MHILQDLQEGTYSTGSGHIILMHILQEVTNNLQEVLLSFSVNWCLSQISSVHDPARTNSISVATHQTWLFITTPCACAMKSKLDRPHSLVEYAS